MEIIVFVPKKLLRVAKTCTPELQVHINEVLALVLKEITKPE
jgi:hypothetical protein